MRCDAMRCDGLMRSWQLVILALRCAKLGCIALHWRGVVWRGGAGTGRTGRWDTHAPVHSSICGPARPLRSADTRFQEPHVRRPSQVGRERTPDPIARWLCGGVGGCNNVIAWDSLPRGTRFPASDTIVNGWCTAPRRNTGPPAAVIPVVQSVRCMKVDPEHPVGRIMTAVECILHSTVLKVLSAGRSLPCTRLAEASRPQRPRRRPDACPRTGPAAATSAAPGLEPTLPNLPLDWSRPLQQLHRAPRCNKPRAQRSQTRPPPQELEALAATFEAYAKTGRCPAAPGGIGPSKLGALADVARVYPAPADKCARSADGICAAGGSCSKQRPCTVAATRARCEQAARPRAN